MGNRILPDDPNEIPDLPGEEPVYVICGLDGYLLDHVFGAMKDKCDRCERIVWVSPTTYALKKKYEGRAWKLCPYCFLEQAAKDKAENPDDQHHISITKAQMDEIMRHLNSQNN